MVKTMQPGSVIIDVAIYRCGCMETIDLVTTHSDPIYLKHGVVYYTAANMPGAVARISTIALTNGTIEYALEIANKGYRRMILENPGLAKMVNVIDGRVTYRAVVAALDLPYTSPKEVMA